LPIAAQQTIDPEKIELTPYKDAPALNVSLKASEAKVVYPPADLPVIQRRCSSTFPFSTLQQKEGAFNQC
jgi:hypothetical protein